jgi:hypothetical protein
MHKYINNIIKSLDHQVFIGNFQIAYQNLGLRQITLAQLYQNIRFNNYTMKSQKEEKKSIYSLCFLARGQQIHNLALKCLVMLFQATLLHPFCWPAPGRSNLTSGSARKTLCSSFQDALFFSLSLPTQNNNIFYTFSIHYRYRKPKVPLNRYSDRAKSTYVKKNISKDKKKKRIQD